MQYLGLSATRIGLLMSLWAVAVCAGAVPPMAGTGPLASVPRAATATPLNGAAVARASNGGARQLHDRPLPAGTQPVAPVRTMVAMVPEPASLLLLFSGLLAFAYARSRTDERREHNPPRDGSSAVGAGRRAA